MDRELLDCFAQLPRPLRQDYLREFRSAELVKRIRVHARTDGRLDLEELSVKCRKGGGLSIRRASQRGRTSNTAANLNGRSRLKRNRR